MYALWNVIKHDVIKNLIDKLIIGAIVGTAALYAAHLFEESKSVNSAYVEFNKTKIMKLAEVWEQAYLLNSSLHVYEDFYKSVDEDIKSELKNMQQQIRDGVLPKQAELTVLNAEKRITRDFKKKLPALTQKHLKPFNDILNKNKFWLDPEHLTPLLEYSKVVNEIARTASLTNKESKQRLKALRIKADEYSKTINDVRDQLLKQSL
ncbi:hypothetical protein QNE82_001466 [Vibrio alginolyticus]|uniref:hypothetical protein n=1 Tax=Vibrio alginolyticus TaxID=663 RepID=UPI001D939D23|nr:hypothetical protein [Vibrio alginolyticus]EGR1298344.1 hypothetical protein [Vibrio alginolyticus]EKL9831009.1 hypothetical protein [Vibrio alginolyticus]ELB2819346.1 hypothetical protein [Vibrio alginolyticus]MCR9488434.1 hypothetical protein [Vibrio alginolyticus]MCR9568792.1 hypothetical protein [Vibrio alginolyticus]